MDDQVGLLFDVDRRGRDRMVVGFTTTLPMEPVFITTYVVSSNPTQARCTRYNIM